MGPLAAADRITGSLEFHDLPDGVHDLQRFFPATVVPHQEPAADLWRINPRPSILCGLLRPYADQGPKWQQCANPRHGQA